MAALPIRRSVLGLLDLRKDLLVMVLELIPAKKELKALCLVSHALRILTLPHLYHKIEINSRSQLEWDRFHRSIAAGAASHFHHTKSLTIWDTKGNNVPIYPLLSIPKVAELREQDDEDHMSDADQCRVVHDVLKEFEKAGLRTFRFASEVSGLDQESWTMLRKHVETLQHLHIDLSELPEWMRPSLKTLDVRIQHEVDPINLTRLINESPSASINSFHLEFDNDMGHIRTKFDEMLSNREISLAHLKRLTTLSFRGVNLNDLDAWRVALPDLSNLEKLTLHNCPGANAFLAYFGNQCTESNSRLEHLSVELEKEEDESYDHCLRGVYKHCDRLQSLHISWYDREGDWIPKHTLKSLQRFGHHIRSLSFHNHRLATYSQTLSPKELRTICTDCPNLEQFGFQVTEKLTNGDREVEWPRELRKFQEYFSQLPKLRIIHFRQDTTRLSDIPPDLTQWEADQVSTFIQDFINKFISMVKWQPALRYVIWGSDADKTEIEDDDDDPPEVIAQHCWFVGEASDGMPGGRRLPICIPVTQDRIKRYDPDLDILKYDPSHVENVKSPLRFYEG